MNSLINFQSMSADLQHFFSSSNAFGSVLIFAFALFVAYWVSNFPAKLIIKIAQKVAVRSDNESDDDRLIQLRQTETYLSVAVAGIRAIFVAITAYITWQFISPTTSGGVAAIGASAFFIVFAGQTVGILLRDMTSGITMIIENWFHIGDFIKIEPFIDVSGVVERLTLRSTKIRSLNGEVIWIHNQQIHGVHVTPKGLRTMAVDIFVKDRERGEAEVKKVISVIPTGPMMLVKPLRITSTEQWAESLWRITVTGQTPPGREWLIETYFVDALKDIDDGVREKSDRVIVRRPIARFADPIADSRFKRAVRIKRDK